MKLGKTELGKEQAKTHTGAVAVDDDVFTAMCRRYGVVRCNSVDEMVDFALAFGQKRLPSGNKLAIVTTSGGAVGLALDAVGTEGGILSNLNPETIKKMETFAYLTRWKHITLFGGKHNIFTFVFFTKKKKITIPHVF